MTLQASLKGSPGISDQPLRATTTPRPLSLYGGTFLALLGGTAFLALAIWFAVAQASSSWRC